MRISIYFKISFFIIEGRGGVSTAGDIFGLPEGSHTRYEMFDSNDIYSMLPLTQKTPVCERIIVALSRY